MGSNGRISDLIHNRPFFLIVNYRDEKMPVNVSNGLSELPEKGQRLGGQGLYNVFCFA
jgi:hypothetical protein